MPGITLVVGLVLRNTDTNHDYRGCGRVDRIAEIALFLLFSFYSKLQNYFRQSIRGEILPS